MKLWLLAAMLVVLAGAARADDAARPAYWGSPSVDGGKCCQTLAEVRDNIDRLDREIVKLMAERQKYVGEAGRFKKDPAAVSAPARVEAIIAKVKAPVGRRGSCARSRRTRFSRDDRRVRRFRARRVDEEESDAGEVAPSPARGE